METQEFTYKPRIMKKVVFGLFVIAAGVLLLLFNVGQLPQELKPIIFSWQMLIVAIGVINIFSRDSWFIGLALTALGAYFLSSKVGFIQFFNLPFDIFSIVLPAVIILAGIFIIVKRRWFHSKRDRWHRKMHAHCYEKKNEFMSSSVKDGIIEELCIFGGVKKRIEMSDLQGGKLINVFGGMELDLTKCKLAPGQHTIELVCIFGGAVLIIPTDWKVKIEMVSVFGGFSDKTLQEVNPGDETTVRIKGVAIFGGGELKNTHFQ